MQIRKKGDEIKKKSPLKLLSWLILKHQWTIEEISIFSNSSHLEWRAGLTDTILKGTHPGTIPAGMVPGWVPFKIVSVSAVLYPRWPPLLKIEMFSIGQNCSILSQNVPKFELYKHNDEL
jgi:hypothetical protein